MRGFLYALLLGSLFFVTLDRVRISQLQPVAAVAVWDEEGRVVMQTDSESRGEGESVAGAVEDLKRNASAVVYLDTAKYLLISESALHHTDELRMYLKESVKVCVTDNFEDIAGLVQYLNVHGGQTKLKEFDPEKINEKR